MTQPTDDELRAWLRKRATDTLWHHTRLGRDDVAKLSAMVERLAAERDALLPYGDVRLTAERDAGYQACQREVVAYLRDGREQYEAAEDIERGEHRRWP